MLGFNLGIVIFDVDRYIVIYNSNINFGIR